MTLRSNRSFPVLTVLNLFGLIAVFIFVYKRSETNISASEISVHRLNIVNHKGDVFMVLSNPSDQALPNHTILY
jgi:hypothetical protein